MKALQFLVTTTFFISGLSVTTLAQSPKSFPLESKPTEVTATSAEQKGAELKDACGFTGVFFSKADMYELISTPNSVGVRFYISKGTKDQQYTDVMAVSIDKDGNEIGQSFQRQYLVAKALDVSYPNYAKGLNKYEAEAQCKNAISGKSAVQPFTSYIGNEDLANMMSVDGCNGVRIYASEVTVEGASYRTMAFGSVNNNKGVLNNVSDVYMESQMPCPIQCGGGGDKAYLWNR